MYRSDIPPKINFDAIAESGDNDKTQPTRIDDNPSCLPQVAKYGVIAPVPANYAITT